MNYIHRPIYTSPFWNLSLAELIITATIGSGKVNVVTQRQVILLYTSHTLMTEMQDDSAIKTRVIPE